MEIKKRVRLANKAIFSDVSILRDISSDGSIMNPLEQIRIENVIKSISRDTHPEKFLDVGTGLGNVLKIGRRYFNSSWGCDLSLYLLNNLKQEFATVPLVCCDAEALAFKNNVIDCVSVFATLHHIVDYEKVIEEIAQVVKKGGYLYIDHEHNFFLIRYYRIFLKLIYFLKLRRMDNNFTLANFHIFHSKGINPELIKKKLISLGFSHVNVEYRFTTNPHLRLSYALVIRILKLICYIYPFKSCYTHFAIIAKK